jgi:hypothetical protein
MMALCSLMQKKKNGNEKGGERGASEKKERERVCVYHQT